MSADSKSTEESFLGRWSRRKLDARGGAADEAEVPPPAALAADDAPPQLPPIDELTLESDFRGFFHPKVGEDVRRAALRKLFSDPHFNVMDGLDVYIDDYSKTEPIPPAMLAGLRQAQRILSWAEGKDDAEDAAADAPQEALAADADASAVSMEALDTIPLVSDDARGVAPELPQPASSETE